MTAGREGGAVGPALDEAVDGWLRRHAENGSAAALLLNPPAAEAALDALQARIGFALPDDLRALWRRADGQRDAFGAEAPTGRWLCPLFGSYSFSSVAEALDSYLGWLDIYGEGGPAFDEAFNDEAAVQRREGDPVHREYWRPGWLPFSLDGGGNSYAVDLAPAPGGTYGQVIVIGPDEDLRRVLAPSLAAFLAGGAMAIPAFDPGAERPVHFFDMESRPT